MKALSQAQVLAYFGDPTGYMHTNGTVSSRWEERILTTIKLPAPLPASWDPKLKIRSLQVHKRVAPFLDGAMHALFRDGEAWKTIGDCGGCYNFRTIGGKKELSHHAWAIAIDMDVRDNPMFGLIPRVHKRTKAIMQSYGFVWGGAQIWGGAFPWSRRDAMHWEFANVSVLS